MRIVIQRVSRASVAVDGEVVSAIGQGLLILLGVTAADGDEDIGWLTRKVAAMRIFDDDNHVMNRSVVDVGGECLVVSQFTLLADTRRGNRPSWIGAAPREISEPMYRRFCDALARKTGKAVKTGVFGADMKVELVNDGPVTICMDSKTP